MLHACHFAKADDDHAMMEEFVDEMEADAATYVGKSPTEFLDIMFDLVMHDNERLSTLAIGLAARQCAQHDELLTHIEGLTLLPAEAINVYDEFVDGLGKLKRFCRLLKVDTSGRHYQDILAAELQKTLGRMMSDEVGQEQAYHARCFFRELEVEVFIFDVIELYRDTVTKTPDWQLESRNFGIKDIFKECMVVLSNACIGNPTTQAAIFDRIWVLL